MAVSFLFELRDGYYEPPRAPSPVGRVFALSERPGAGEVVTIDLTVAEVRAVREGCWLDRALAFAAFGRANGPPTPRQRLLVSDEPVVCYQLRQIARLEPEAVAGLRAQFAGRCVPRLLLRAAAHSRHRGDWRAQVRAAAAAIGTQRGGAKERRERRRDELEEARRT